MKYNVISRDDMYNVGSFGGGQEWGSTFSMGTQERLTMLDTEILHHLQCIPVTVG